MHRYFLELSYKGTHYSGWQVQKNAVSVQQKINEGLTTLLVRPLSLSSSPMSSVGCGRTDTGVHATQFFAHFDTPFTIEDKNAFLHQLNGILPSDISVKEVHAVSQDAHARFDAVRRTYKYYLHTHKNVFLSEFSGCFFKKLDRDSMNEASSFLFRYNDFNSFCKSNAQSKTSLCTITKAQWTGENGMYIFEIEADRFLRGMVRAVVGTLVDVGSQKISVRDFEDIIKAKDRRKAGPAAPAAGLYLCKIDYPYLQVENTFRFPFYL